MNALMRARDWSTSPLGHPETWPQSLRSVVGLLLASKFPMFLAWGKELGFIYNDPYAQILGAKHPNALGRRFHDVWSEIWSDISPFIDAAMIGEAVYQTNLPLVMNRTGFDEQTWFTFSYSPVRDESGEVAGMFCACTETTGQVLTERRQAFQLALEERLGGLTDPRMVVNAAAEALGQHLGADRVGYGEIQADDATVVLASCFANDIEPILGTFNLDAFGPDNIARQRGGRTEVCDDVMADPGQVHATWAAIETRSFISVPLIRGGRFTASLYVNFRNVHRWTEAEVTLIEDVAARTWDAVERARAQADLRQSEAALRELNETLESRVAVLAAERDQIWRLSRTPFVVCDTEGRWLSASPAWTDILGWTEAELIGRTSEWMKHPDDRGKPRDKLVGVAAGEVMSNVTKRFRDRDGHYHSFSWTAVAEGGRLFCVARDVTEEIERAAALRLHANIVQSDPSPICAFDTNYRLITFNRAHNDEFHRVNGFYTQVGDVFPDLFIPEQRPVMRALMSRALSGELFTVVEKFGRPELGRPYWEISYTPLRDEMGQIIGAFHHARDISSRLHAEAELAAAQETLRQSQKMEAVGQLTGGIAHDFNNLLAGISGSLELLQTRVAQGRLGDLERYLVAAQGAAKRAAALTHRLLAFSRRQTLEPKATDVSRLIAGMEDLIRRTVGPAIAVEVAGSGELWNTLVDPSQLENALLNLCINARDAMPDGGRLTVETRNCRLDERGARTRDLASGDYISLCVSDTGTGMTPEVAAKAFDPFFTTKPIGQGTGLGLSMIYGFTRQSGGQARIHSEPGRGTTVCLYLPRHLGAVADADAPAELAQAPRARQGETVLVVDDEPTVRMLVTDVLKELSYATLEAEDGASGLDVLRSNARIDLLVTDVGLPGGMNGRQVADAARVLRPEMKVLFITGYAESAVLSHGDLEPGMQVLVKPFAMEALATRVKDLVSKQ